MRPSLIVFKLHLWVKHLWQSKISKLDKMLINYHYLFFHFPSAHKIGIWANESLLFRRSCSCQNFCTNGSGKQFHLAAVEHFEATV